MAERTTSHPEPHRGDQNLNPEGMSLPQLWAEDFATYRHDALEPGFWAVSLHRFGNWRMGRPKIVRAPCTVVYRTLSRAIEWGWGIDLAYTVKLGRRVRLWHHGGMFLGAHSIGNDVHIRHNTTFGLAHRSDLDSKPVIGDGVDVGVGACILGNVTVGDNAVIGANSVVVSDVAPGTTVFGVPARPINLNRTPVAVTTMGTQEAGPAAPPATPHRDAS